MFNALVNVKTQKVGDKLVTVVQDPDLATIEDLETITNMGIAYEEEYRQAFIQTNNATKAHQIAIDKIKANYRDENQKQETVDINGKKKLLAHMMFTHLPVNLRMILKDTYYKTNFLIV